ncbi:hypothetical protein OXX80_004153 [Metschnikowia pulcherrima]
MSSGGHVTGTYFSNWSVYECKDHILDLPAGIISHVFYAFMKINPETGAVTLSDPWADVQMPLASGINGAINVLNALKARSYFMKTVMSIGGWGTCAEFVEVMKDDRRMATFVLTTIDLLKKYNFDGIDIDWEYPSNTTEARQLVNLLHLLRFSLDKVNPHLCLTVAAPAGEETISTMLVKEMDQYLTFWNIMTYDFAGSGWSDRTGFHSNLYGPNGDNGLSADLVIGKYLERGVPASKLVLGMPMYGRGFKRPSAKAPGGKFKKSTDVKDDSIDFRKIDRTGEVHDTHKVAAYVYDRKRDLLITYDSPRTIKEKAKYVLQTGLGGGFFWDSKGDTRSSLLIKAFVNGLNGQPVSDEWPYPLSE